VIKQIFIEIVVSFWLLVGMIGISMIYTSHIAMWIESRDEIKLFIDDFRRKDK